MILGFGLLGFRVLRIFRVGVLEVLVPSVLSVVFFRGCVFRCLCSLGFAW